ncbi:hypothetical protein B4N84_11365 [Flavobacterium sp. IR1]|nr:hypothetical protein B4N84_11365 [Flavobacterium sp. IR1]
MRQSKIVLFLLICFISCKVDEKESSKKQEKKIAHSLSDTIFVDDEGVDTIKAYSYNLKNKYKLTIFPAWDNDKKVIKFRLLKDQKENVYSLNDIFVAKYSKKYNNIDFEKYFALHSNGGGTSKFYFWLYDKETGKECLTGIERDFDLKNELILYEDEDDQYKLFVFDVNTKIKTLVEIPQSFMNKQECTKYGNALDNLVINKVSNDYYYFGFGDFCPSIAVFKVKKGS